MEKWSFWLITRKLPKIDTMLTCRMHKKYHERGDTDGDGPSGGSITPQYAYPVSIYDIYLWEKLSSIGSGVYVVRTEHI